MNCVHYFFVIELNSMFRVVKNHPQKQMFIIGNVIIYNKVKYDKKLRKAEDI